MGSCGRCSKKNYRWAIIMRNPFKRNKQTQEDSVNTLATNDCETTVTTTDIVPEETLVAEPVDTCERYDAKVNAGAAKQLLDSLIPLGTDVADAVNQYGHAIVRFPKDANGVQLGFNDLMHRKTPGWEDWQQLGGLKDGKFQPMAAIKQAKLSPTAVANLALQGAAVVVGQAYMAEISSQLEGIQRGIDGILAEMERERRARLLSNFDMLKRYASMPSETIEVPEKRQAVFDKIEDIVADANNAWIFQLETMRDGQKRIAKSKRLNKQELDTEIAEVADMEAKAAAAFQLMAAAEQVAMMYEDDHSAKRLAAEQERMQQRLAEYADVRGSLYGTLHKQIDRMRGRGLSIPEAKEAGGDAVNPVVDTTKAALRQLERITPAALIVEGGRVHHEAKNAFHDEAGNTNPVKDTGEARLSELAEMDYMYNRADMLIIDENGISFASSDDGDQNQLS